MTEVDECGFDELWLCNIDHTWWGIALEIFMTLYSFLGLAIVCDEYMVPALETLCRKWGVREDVAGASLLGLGSAAPEIVINLITTIKAQGSDPEAIDLGVSSIIGSGMIAFCLIPGCCALVATDTLYLKRRPLARDILTFALSLGLLCYFFGDGEIQLYEGATLCGLYVFYLLILILSPMIRQNHREKKAAKRGEKLDKRKSFVIQINEDEDSADVDPLLDTSLIDDEEEEEGGFFTWLGAPLALLFKYTVPDCAEGKPMEGWYLLGFALSMVWVAVFSFIVSSTIMRWVKLTELSMAFFGLLLVAMGAQIPDTIQSLSVAKKGYGSMAVANAFGSQIVNINVGLSFPWLIMSLLGKNVEIQDHDGIQVAAFFLAGGVLLVTVLLLGHTLMRGLNKIPLSRFKGLTLVFCYFLMVAGYGYYIFFQRKN